MIENSIVSGLGERFANLKSASFYLTKDNYKQIFENSAIAITVP